MFSFLSPSSQKYQEGQTFVFSWNRFLYSNIGKGRPPSIEMCLSKYGNTFIQVSETSDLSPNPELHFWKSGQLPRWANGQ